MNEAIESIGMGRFQWALFGLCGAGWALDSLFLQAVSVISTQVQNEFNLSTREYMYLQVFNLLGMTIGAFFWGILADYIGRRPVFSLTLIFCSVFAIATACSPNYSFIVPSIILMGFGIGGNIGVDGSLFLEFLPQKKQSLLSMLGIFWPIGQFLLSIVSWTVFSRPQWVCDPKATCTWRDNIAWRVFMLISAGITFLVLIARFNLVPQLESPRFLVSKGRYQDAIDTIAKLARINDVKEYKQLCMQDLINAEPSNLSVTPENQSKLKRTYLEAKTNFASLFENYRMGTTTILVWAIYSLVQFGGFIFFGFLFTFLSRHGTADALSPSQSARNYLIASFVPIFGPILAMYMSETRLGRKYTMIIGAVFTAASLYLYTVFVSSDGQLLSSCIAGFFQDILYSTLYAYSPEVFPTQSRGTGVGIANGLGRIHGIFAPMATAALLDISFNAPVYGSTLCFLVTAVFMMLLPIETRGRPI